VDVVNRRTPGDGQSLKVFDLHVESLRSHHITLTDLADAIRPEDDAFVDHCRTPPIPRDRLVTVASV
jgi:hypothetical protein